MWHCHGKIMLVHSYLLGVVVSYTHRLIGVVPALASSRLAYQAFEQQQQPRRSLRSSPHGRSSVSPCEEHFQLEENILDLLGPKTISESFVSPSLDS
ncbi:hypothetical protein EDC04DRAFT_2682106 [Pisolithus marmoratus]|nr:hypothetical protein EDC04DRAFT_2682106 [Pisolithus marmoratus]